MQRSHQPKATDDLPTLNALSRAAKGGEASAYKALVQHLAGPITGFAARLLGDRTEAEDVAQESFARLWRAYDLSPPKGSVRAWLYRTAQNLCIDRLRKRGRTTAMPEGHDPVDPTPNAEAKAIERDRQKALQAALNDLPPRQHSAILLVHFQGLSGREAAAVMEIGEEALESLLARGRRSLRAALTPKDPAP
jgi:RNA polymerase sigma-70 factor (ECF subfamily)